MQGCDASVTPRKIVTTIEWFGQWVSLGQIVPQELLTLDDAVHTAKQSCLEVIETKLGNYELTLISELGKRRCLSVVIQVW